MRISYTLKETCKNLWRNRLMSLASITSVTATLLILGIVFVLVTNITNFSQAAKDQVNGINIYLEDQLDKEQVVEIGENIHTLEGVKTVAFKSKAEALKKMKEDWGQEGYLLDDLDKNPFPNSYEIELLDISYTEAIVNKLNSINGIEEVKYHQDIVEKIISISLYIRNVGLILIVILIIISIFIINNTIKLALNSRKREISIMKYVGATSWFIRWPFILEGAILGLLGACIGTWLIHLIYNYTYSLLSSEFYSLIAAYIIDVDTLLRDILILFAVIGTGIGALGSLTSIRKHLNV